MGALMLRLARWPARRPRRPSCRKCRHPCNGPRRDRGPGCRGTGSGTPRHGVRKGAELHQMQHSAVRVNTRCLRRSVRPYGVLGLPGGRRGGGDLGLHSPPGSDATMMQLIPLRGPHHRCTCWHRDAPGSSRLHRAHHRQAQRPARGRHRSCEARAGLPHHWSRHAPDLATSRSGCT